MATLRKEKGGVLTRNISIVAHSHSFYSNTTHASIKTRRKNKFISTFFNTAAKNFYTLNNSNQKFSFSKIVKPTACLKNSTRIIQKAGASLCTYRLTEEPDIETAAIWEAFGSAQMDLDWVYDIIPHEILEPIPIPDWYVNFLGSEQEMDNRLDALIANNPPPSSDSQPEPTTPPEPVLPQPDTATDNIEESPLVFESTPPTIFSDSDTQPSSPRPREVPQPIPSPKSIPDETSMQYMPPILDKSIDPSKLPKYHKPESSISLFNTEFPLPRRLYRKWKDGIPIWSTKAYAKKCKDIVTVEKTLVLKELLNNNIISKTIKGPYVSDFFLLQGKDKVRPIFNYSQLTKSLNPPKFCLPSLYQIIKRNDWQNNLYYIKLDFKQAFFNLNLSPKAKHLTTFIYNKEYFCFNFLPFGLATAPFVAQMCLNQITAFIRRYTKWVWGHIDDIIIAHTSKEVLNNLVKALLEKLARIKWEINFKKSSLTPKKSINFLGAIWNQYGVKRCEDITLRLPGIISLTRTITKHKSLQKIRGFLNYYLCYSKYFNTLINKFISNPISLHRFMLALVEIDFIPFETSYNENIEIFSDATPTQIGAYVNNIPFRAKIKHSNIMVSETLAATLAILQAKQFTNVKIHVDNIATLGFLRKGAAKFLNALTIEEHFIFLLLRYHMDTFYNISSFYINTLLNPADYLSRT